MSGKHQEPFANWRLLSASFVGIMTGVGVVPLYVLGPLIKPLEADLGWSAPEVLTSLSFLAIGVTLGTPIVGRLADRFHPQPLAVTTTVLLGGSFAAIGLTSTALWQFQLLYFVMGFIAAGSTGLIYLRAIAASFHKARGLALGIALSGSGVCSFAAPLLVHSVNEAAGWRYVFLALAALVFILVLPITYLGLGKVGQHQPLQHSDSAPAVIGFTRAEAMRDGRFYCILMAICLFGIFNTSVVVNIVPRLIDSGVGAGEAAKIASLLGVAVILGRLIVGWLLDQHRASLVGFFAFATAAVGCFLLGLGGVAPSVVGVLATGALIGAEIDVVSYMTARYFGIRHYGEIYGLLYMALAATAIVGPLICGEIIRRSSSETMLAVAAGGYVVAALSFLILARIEGETA